MQASYDVAFLKQRIDQRLQSQARKTQTASHLKLERIERPKDSKRARAAKNAQVENWRSVSTLRETLKSDAFSSVVCAPKLAPNRFEWLDDNTLMSIVELACAQDLCDKGWLLAIRLVCKSFRATCKEVVKRHKWSSQVTLHFERTLMKAFDNHIFSLRPLLLLVHQLLESISIDSIHMLVGLVCVWTNKLLIQATKQPEAYSNHFIEKCELVCDAEAYIARRNHPLAEYASHACRFHRIENEFDAFVNGDNVSSRSAKVLVMVQALCDAALRMHVPPLQVRATVDHFMEHVTLTPSLKDGVDAILRISNIPQR